MTKAGRAILIICLGLAPVAALAGARAAIGRPAVLFNPSPSEPPGLYRLSTAQPVPGRIIAFKVPTAGRAYADAHLTYVARNAILKQIAAGEGAFVCERAGLVSIDGQVRGKVADADRAGVLLPHWSGCRRLASGQFFVLSNRIPNSFDSRYYGPVSRSDLLGVYQPLWTE
jgi:conjugative transfer signal peptidase TraF